MERGEWLESLTVNDKVVIKTVLCCETIYDLDWIILSISENEIIVIKDGLEQAFSKNKGEKLCEVSRGEQGEAICLIISPHLVNNSYYLLAEDAMREIGKLTDCSYSEEAVMIIFLNSTYTGRFID